MSQSRRAFVQHLGIGTIGIAGAGILAGCGGNNTNPTVQVPGSPASGESKVLTAGAEVLQSMPPIKQINMYLDGFHFYADDMGRQVEAHHFCIMLNEDLHQCVIFDSNGEKARLIGVEYIVSEKLFKTLPDDEKYFWHSHHYEVKSGELIMPGIPDTVEHAAMEKLITTYGKTWHMWQVDRRDELPLGIPQLMMGFTKDGQANASLVSDRDQRFGVSTDSKKANRQDIPMPTLIPGANGWEQSGKTVWLDTKVVPVKNLKT
jgi:hypothetical protein